jgi:hypothetical protein
MAIPILFTKPGHAMPSHLSFIDAELRAALHDGTHSIRHAAVITALTLQRIGPEEELAAAAYAAQACLDTLHALEQLAAPATPDGNEPTSPEIQPTPLADTVAEIGKLSRLTLLELAAAEHDPHRRLAFLSAAVPAARLHHLMQSVRP